jgi:hypothetical protein
MLDYDYDYYYDYFSVTFDHFLTWSIIGHLIGNLKLVTKPEAVFLVRYDRRS